MTHGCFLAIIVTSAVVMFGPMYPNTFLLGHVFWSETRAYIAILMGAVLAIIMLDFMFYYIPENALILRYSSAQQLSLALRSGWSAAN
jgi:hypothetical protein